MPFDSERLKEIERRRKRIRQSKISYMNNTKWRELLHAIEANEIYDFPAELKCIDGDYVYSVSSNLGVSSWAANATADRFGGPVAFKDIEWINIPNTREIERYNRNEKLESTFISYSAGLKAQVKPSSK